MSLEKTTAGTDNPEGLTGIHRGIHCAATPEGEQDDEAERLQLSHFYQVLAEVAIAVAKRNRGQCSPSKEDQI